VLIHRLDPRLQILDLCGVPAVVIQLLSISISMSVSISISMSVPAVVIQLLILQSTQLRLELLSTGFSVGVEKSIKALTSSCCFTCSVTVLKLKLTNLQL
jgi:hypothetical protein